MILGDQGATSSKLGRHRRGRAATNFEGASPHYLLTAIETNGCCADLSKPDGVEVMYEMIKTTDVFVELAPNAADGSGWVSQTPEINPNLIYCSISGFGPSGPTGSASVRSNHSGPRSSSHSDESGFSYPDLVRHIVADKSTSYTAAQAITTALFARDRGAGGQHIEVPMIDASFFFWPDGMIRHTLENTEELPGNSLYETYRLWHTQDGQIITSASQVEHEGLFNAGASSGLPILALATESGWSPKTQSTGRINR